MSKPRRKPPVVECPTCHAPVGDGHDSEACAKDAAERARAAAAGCTPEAPCGLASCQWCAPTGDAEGARIIVSLPAALLARVGGKWDALTRPSVYREAPPRKTAQTAVSILLSQAIGEIDRLEALSVARWGAGSRRERAESVVRHGTIFAPVAARAEEPPEPTE